MKWIPANLVDFKKFHRLYPLAWYVVRGGIMFRDLDYSPISLYPDQIFRVRIIDNMFGQKNLYGFSRIGDIGELEYFHPYEYHFSKSYITKPFVKEVGSLGEISTKTRG